MKVVGTRTPPQAAARGRWRIAPRHWNLRVKLAVVMLVPGVLAIVLATLRTVDQTAELADLAQVDLFAQAQAADAAVVSALESERLQAVGFAAGGPVAPWNAAGQQVERARDAAAASAAVPAGQQRFDEVVDRVDALRAQVRRPGARPADVLSGYSDLITEARRSAQVLLGGVTGLESNGPVRGIEYLGVVRDEASFQAAVLGIATELPDAEQMLRSSRDRMTAAVGEVRSALGAARADGLGLGLAVTDPPTLVAAVDAADVELRVDITRINAAQKQAAVDAVGINTMVLMLALLIGGTLVGLIASQMVRSVGVLRRAALDVAWDRLPDVVQQMRDGDEPDARIAPVPVDDRDEIGELARAFDAVHGQAVRLASEQAGLRKAVDAVYVNLSRRSQSLVDRQLQLLENLERNEEDPAQLANLFQLDHLAARMRRNCENLLVLGGNEPTNRPLTRVSTVDVLRAAVSEIEQYERIFVAQSPGVQILGQAAVDLQHLLAELLDNATSFSPPDSSVRMTATMAGGSMIIRIIDEGVGMRPAELDALNNQLANPAASNMLAVRRMGLFVVARIAARHGLTVRLTDNENGLSAQYPGLTASVTVPANLIAVPRPERAPQPSPARRTGRPEAADGSGRPMYPGLPAALPPTAAFERVPTATTVPTPTVVAPAATVPPVASVPPAATVPPATMVPAAAVPPAPSVPATMAEPEPAPGGWYRRHRSVPINWVPDPLTGNPPPSVTERELQIRDVARVRPDRSQV